MSHGRFKEYAQAAVMLGVIVANPFETSVGKSYPRNPDLSKSSTGQVDKAQSEKQKGQESKEEKYKWEIESNIQGNEASIWISNGEVEKTFLLVFCSKIITNGNENFRILISEETGKYTHILVMESDISSADGLTLVDSVLGGDTKKSGENKQIKNPTPTFKKKSLDAIGELMGKDPKFAEILADPRVVKKGYMFGTSK